ncbi:hypothetical protein TVAG_482500 [Trichomonas vaginalis G3]|uniref:Uncharacterized protein n=1 Tax=Trichomonas vaginalis (strain ATCC PRA-98 / G3) TaxID=412133 RepID=A2G4U4_TRIV3|nr:protein ubiquitination [Trichomonas vaginalis G3]EAX87825.1 hypothetical protein TVAG_482500 [Trichomonas vaginalis G3]KAI5535549.1 protein ubiquitination [Trichomonas vaginalis G3]|eukprot:XP_001300755.1 hypothetical protein [Trichomonas vaginalis G3]
MNHSQTSYMLTEEFVKAFIAETDNIDRDFNGKTLARICVENGRLDLLKPLIDNGCKPDFLIRAAVRSHQFEIMKYLIEKGFNVNETTAMTASALYAAVTENLPEYGKELLDNGADPTVTFKDQALLSYAARNLSPQFFRMLIEKGAPISALPPALPPLITALKKQQMNIVAILLSLGADPDSYYQSHDNKAVLYPLDLAFRNKSSSAMTMLLMTGARKHNINIDELEDDMKKQLEECSNPIPCRDPQIQRDIRLLISQFKPLESLIHTLAGEISQVQDTKRITIAPLLSSIRNVFERLTDFIPRVLQMSKTIDDKRLPILKKQFLIFEQDDRKKLTPVVVSDNDKWRSLFSRTIELMNRNKSRGALQKNAFIDYCNTELRKRAEKFADQQSSVLIFNDEVAMADQNEMYENKEALAFYADILKQFKSLLKMIHDSLISIQQTSETFFSMAIEHVDEEEKRLEMLSSSETMFYRAGLSVVMIQEIQDSIQPKKELVRQTKLILVNNKQMTENCSNLLRKCIRQCVK